MAQLPASHSGRPPILVQLSGAERQQLENSLGDPSTSSSMRKRFQAILLAADGHSTEEIANRLGISSSQVSGWRRRFADFGFQGIIEQRIRRGSANRRPTAELSDTDLDSRQKLAEQRASAGNLQLSNDQLKALQHVIRQPRIENRLAQRARAVFLAHQGMSAPAIGRRLDMASPRVLHWCRRFLEEGVSGLADRPRSGRPRKTGQPVPKDALAEQDSTHLGFKAGSSLGETQGLDTVASVSEQAQVQAQVEFADDSTSAKTMLMLSGADVIQCLAMNEAVEAMRTAFTALAQGQVVQPVRSHLSPPESTGITLVMPAWVRSGQPEGHTTVKVVSVYPDNAAVGEKVLHGLVVLIDATNGKVLAAMDGGTLTAMRTGAVSGLATDLLTAPTANRLAVLGAGVQARTQAAAVSAVRPLEQISVYAPTADHVVQMIRDLKRLLPEHIEYQAASSAREALSGSDIVCCATSSSTPVFTDSDLERGAHINAVGVFQPDRREIPEATVARAKVYVDDREAMHEEAGDLVLPMAAGTITEEHIVGTLGELLTGQCAGRSAVSETTFFKSVGLAIQDTISASVVYANAIESGIGTVVEL